MNLLQKLLYGKHSLIYTFIALAIVWSIVVILSLNMQSNSMNSFIKEAALLQAREGFMRDVAYRKWAATYGGVYVKDSLGMIANPYLAKHPKRDIYTSDGERYTLINPAYMTRLVHQLFKNEFGRESHITSLKLVRPENKGDEWENKALQKFSKASDEEFEIIKNDTLNALRFMKPLMVDKLCLKCHKKQGYNIGDVRGGISITIPLKPIELAASNDFNISIIVHLMGLILGYGFLFTVFKVVSEKRKSEKKSIKEKNDLIDSWQSTFNAIYDSISIIDADGKILQANNATSKMFNIESDKICTQKCWQLLHNTQQPIKNYPLLISNNTKKLESQVFQRGKNWYKVTVVPILSKDNLILKFVHIVQDISNIISSEKALLKQKQKLESYLNLVNSIVIIADKNNKLISLNNYASSLIGVSENSVLGKNWIYELVSEKDRDEVEKEIVKLLTHNDKDQVEFEAKIFDSDGEEKEVLWRVIKISISDFTMDEIIVVGQDLTAERKIQAELVRAFADEQYFANIVREAPIPISVGNFFGEISDCNDAFCKLIGYTKDEVASLNWKYDLTPERYYNLELNMINQLDEHNSQTFRKAYKHKSGREIPIEITVKKIYKQEFQTEEIVAFIIDLSEKLKDEEKIIKAESNWRNLISNLQGIAYRCINDEHWTMIFLSEGIERISGWKVDDVLGNKTISYQEIIHPKDRKRVRETVEKAINNKLKFSLEYRIVTKEGKTKWVFEQGGLSYIDEDTTYLDGYISDIDKLKSIETKIKENELRYRTIFNEVPVAIWDEDFSELYQELEKLKQKNIDVKKYCEENPKFLIDAVRKIKVNDINEYAVKLHKAKSKDELLNSVAKTFTKNSFDVFQQEIVAISEGKTRFFSEATIKTISGEKVNVVLEMRIPSSASEAKNVLVSMVNITDLKLAQGEISKIEKMLTDSERLSKTGSFIYYFNKVNVGLKNNFSEGFLSLVEVKNVDEVDHWKKLIRFIHSDDRKQVIKEIFLSLRHKRYKGTFRITTHKNKEKYITIILNFNFNDENEIVSIFGVVKDITKEKNDELKLRSYSESLEDKVQKRTSELKRSNEELIRIQESLSYLLEDVNTSRAELEQMNRQLLESNAELESFSYAVSHDLKAPIRALDGFSEILLDDYYDVLDEDGKTYLSKIRESSFKMSKLIDSLLELGRLTRLKMELREINISEIASTSYKNVVANYSKLNINFEIESNLFAKCDANLIEIVLDNLFGNAIKFSSNKKEIKVKFGYNSEKKCYFVKDNGIGFDMNYANKLFIPFSRLHKSEEFPGTGIGLTTVKKIINRHGGKIWVDSELNSGTTFYFSLSN